MVRRMEAVEESRKNISGHVGWMLQQLEEKFVAKTSYPFAWVAQAKEKKTGILNWKTLELGPVL